MARQVIGSEFVFLFYLFLTVLGLFAECRLSLVAGSRGFIVVYRLPIVVTSLIAEHRFWVHRLQKLQLGASLVVAHEL